jgi:hypothetical protein
LVRENRAKLGGEWTGLSMGRARLAASEADKWGQRAKIETQQRPRSTLRASIPRA